MKKNILILIITLLSFLYSQSMYLGNSKKNAYAVLSLYSEGENKSFTDSVVQNSYHEYGIGFTSVINGNHELSFLSRKNNIDNRTWEGFSGIYNFYLKPKSPVKYFFGTAFSRIENKNDNIDEYELKFGLYGDVKGAKSTGLSYYPFFQIGKQREIINFESVDDANFYTTASAGISFMFQDSKTTGIGIEPSYTKIMFDKGDKDCSNIDCDYYYIGLKIYLWEYGSFRKQ